MNCKAPINCLYQGGNKVAHVACGRDKRASGLLCRDRQLIAVVEEQIMSGEEESSALPSKCFNAKTALRSLMCLCQLCFT